MVPGGAGDGRQAGWERIEGRVIETREQTIQVGERIDPKGWEGRIWVGDCLEFMRALPDGCVDAVVTDPPYGTGNANVGDGEVFMPGEWANILPLCLPELYRVLSSSGSIYLFLSNRGLAEWLLRLQSHFKQQNLLIWDKNNHGRTCSPYSWYFTHETIFFGLKGKGQPLRTRGRKDVLHYPRVVHADHPTQKPEGLIGDFIRASTDVGDLVLDPFLGSGTTAVVCERLGRRWIGCEISPIYAEMAMKRIERERAKLQLPFAGAVATREH